MGVVIGNDETGLLVREWNLRPLITFQRTRFRDVPKVQSESEVLDKTLNKRRQEMKRHVFWTVSCTKVTVAWFHWSKESLNPPRLRLKTEPKSTAILEVRWTSWDGSNEILRIPECRTNFLSHEYAIPRPPEPRRPPVSQIRHVTTEPFSKRNSKERSSKLTK